MNRGNETGFDLYLITEGVLHGETHSEEFLSKIEAALKGGVKAIQLREKELDGRPLLEVASLLRELTFEYGAKLFINDRVDVALLSGADGVHLPVSGLKAKEVRGFLNSMDAELLIGVSTHNLREAEEAQSEGADFITFAPVFFTQTKASYGEPAGVNRLAEVVRSLDIPVFALGGIDKGKVSSVMSAGALGVAMISAILGDEDIEESARMIISEL